jgi:hypothetical protein
MKRLLERRMNRQDLQNEELDRIGRRLLGAARLPAEEIDKIVGSPKLFDAVKAGIEAEQKARKSKSFFGGKPARRWLF